MAVALLAGSCKPYVDSDRCGFFSFQDMKDLKLIRRSRVYGECIRLLKPIPIHYELDRANYKLTIKNGGRWFPIAVLSASDNEGNELSLKMDDAKSNEFLCSMKNNSDFMCNPFILSSGLGKEEIEEMTKGQVYLLGLRSFQRYGSFAIASGSMKIILLDKKSKIIDSEILTFKIELASAFGVDAL